MDTRAAKVEQVVFDFLRPKLKQYREQATDLKRAAASSVSKVAAHADAVVAQRRRELKKAQDELEACQAQEGADCSGYARQVRICEQKLADALRGRAMIQEASSRFSKLQSKHTAEVDQLLLRAEKMVRQADERTIRYQKSSQYVPHATMLRSTPLGGRGNLTSTGSLIGTSSSDAPTGRARTDSDTPASSEATLWTDFPGVSVPPHFPDGFALVPVALIENENPVTGPQEFDAGQSLPVLRWATDALLDVVLPAMDRMPDLQNYLSGRDAQEGLSGDRSYTATYRGFFSPDAAIKVSPTQDGFNLSNGRHRLWLLQRAGVDAVPVRIIGDGQ